MTCHKVCLRQPKKCLELARKTRCSQGNLTWSMQLKPRRILNMHDDMIPSTTMLRLPDQISVENRGYCPRQMFPIGRGIYQLDSTRRISPPVTSLRYSRASFSRYNGCQPRHDQLRATLQVTQSVFDGRIRFASFAKRPLWWTARFKV